MKHGMTLEELAAEVQRQADAKRDYVAPTHKLAVDTTSLLHLDGLPEIDGGLPLTHHAHGQLAEYLGMPIKFYAHLRDAHSGLYETLVNGLFREDKPAKRLVRTLDGNVRAFLSDSYMMIDNIDVMSAAMPIIAKLNQADDARVESCNLSTDRLNVKVVFPRVQGDIGLGEFVQAGFMLGNSEIGNGKVTIAPLLYTLSCKNGAVLDQYAKSRRHLGSRLEDTDEVRALFSESTLRASDTVFLMKVEDIVRATVDQTLFDNIVRDVRSMREERVEVDLTELPKRLQRVDLTEGEGKSVLQHLAAGGDLSSWGLCSAITRAAQDVDDYDRSTELETIGGKLITMPVRERLSLIAA